MDAVGNKSGDLLTRFHAFHRDHLIAMSQDLMMLRSHLTVAEIAAVRKRRSMWVRR